MRKIFLSTIIGAVAVIMFMSAASALPVFARQTGMACSDCHFQHFPMLNGFGRAFKSAGYTLVGTQTKVEGEGLSIPSTLNMAVVTTAGYEKTNQTTTAPYPTKSTGDGAVYVPGSGGELSVFFGGRVSENAGFLAELGNGHPPATGTTTTVGIGSAKLPVMYDLSSVQIKGMEGTRVGVVPFTTNFQGASYGFELLNTGANAVHQMSVPGLNGAHAAAISAQQYINTAGYATGVAFVANSSLGFINLTKFNQTGAGGAFAGLTSTYIRVAGIFNLAGWDAAAGIQNWSGKSATNSTATPGVAGALSETEATAVDAQMQGMWKGLPVGLYASYATSPSPASGNTSTYNFTQPTGSGASARSSMNVSGEVGLIPEKLTVGAAVRRGMSGANVNGASNATDNAIMLTSTYKLAQNMLASVSFTKASGSYWYSNGTSGTTDTIGNTTLTVNLFTLF